ncbi:hypothetical protein BDW22DRAFT_1430503 [Trametopsis cervina]|nr:hypothetical protein BDW22DRAFT_1430503 [Trametopsis cervina]
MSSGSEVFSRSRLATSLREARGSASPEAKQAVGKWYGSRGTESQFIYPILSRMEATDVDVTELEDVPGKTQGRIVFEMDVQSDMCNALLAMHGGCTAALIDICTSLTVSLVAFYVSPATKSHVSLVLNTTYHSPAPLNSRIKIVCSTVAFGARTMTAKAEVYDKTHNRLVATGVHVKMQPSLPSKL